MGTKYERQNLNMFFQAASDDDGYYKIKKNNTLVFISDTGDAELIQKVSDSFIYIKDMHIIPSSSSHKTIHFDFSISGKKGIYVFKYSNGKLGEKSILSALNDKGIHIIDEAMFLKACALYCIYYMKNIQFKHVCGWIKQKDELFYIGISSNHESSSPTVSKYFLTNFMCDNKKDYDYTEQQYADHLISLLNLTSKEITYPLLGYVFLSYSYVLIEKHMDFPFLNICKKVNRNLSPSILANLYANTFARDFRCITSIDKFFCLNVDNGKKNAEEYLEKYSDCPIIVTSSKPSISIKSGIGKFIIDYVNNNDMRVFPIFLTKNPVNNDQQFVVLNLNDSKFNEKIYNSLLNDPDIMSALIDDFIEFISCGYDVKELSLKTYYNSFTRIFEYYKVT